ncbi:4-phosphoerythronate dehydrogenase [Halioxenophilus sp. WMMB6]|uniref:4-phosphoerythronate dehydrogenase n=1 Tax=Halioxenophilus sp. WMMB6 TaxID=3073815 RepID=UPI00295ED530|nr:4-phosphoerythronate dehydrogenase [Halioxenophilus sp. WMMB6]
MKIVIDENIPLAQPFFGSMGELCPLPGRAIDAAAVSDADALIVRSVTQVNESLLAGSRVGFVGTCTIGVDHLDTAFLDDNSIAWSSAPGCNANSVVEYVFAALAALAVDWRGKQFTVIGCGNVGGALYRRLQQLSLPCWVVDPALTPEQCPDLVSLEAALAADIICLHTPLTRLGEWPTWHMIGAEQLALMPDKGVLINAGRGAVIDNQALLNHLHGHPQFRAVLDVWEGEPEVSLPLLRRVHLATPHIAGYSYDGKVRGTEMIYQALCRHLGVAADLNLAAVIGECQLALNWSGNRFPEDLQAYLRQCVDLRADDRAMREALQDSTEPALQFDRLRKEYPVRREYPCYHLPEQVSGDLRQALLELGFQE